jgi:hypothetical protein
MQNMTPLRYRLQGKYYDLFLRHKKTPDKLVGQSQSEESYLVLSEKDDEAALGKAKGRGRKRKVFGCIEERVFPKVSKSAAERGKKKLGEISLDMEDSVLESCFSDCSSLIQHTLSSLSASSLLSSCPAFFSKTKFLQQHLKFLTGGNDIFLNCVEHLEFQMVLLYEYLMTKLPKNVRAKLSEEKEAAPSGNDLFMFYVSLFQHLSDLWKMDCSMLFFQIDEAEKCHRDVPTPHAVIVGHDFLSVNVYVDFTLVYRNLCMTDAISAIVALHYATNVHYLPRAHLLLELLQKQVCVLSPDTGTHKPGKETFSTQSREIQSFQQFIGHYLYNKALLNKTV